MDTDNLTTASTSPVHQQDKQKLYGYLRTNIQTLIRAGKNAFLILSSIASKIRLLVSGKPAPQAVVAHEGLSAPCWHVSGTRPPSESTASEDVVSVARCFLGASGFPGLRQFYISRECFFASCQHTFFMYNY